MDEKSRRKGTTPISYIPSTPVSALPMQRQRRRNDQTINAIASGPRSKVVTAPLQNGCGSNPFRELSITTYMEQLSLEPKDTQSTGQSSVGLSYIPIPVPQAPLEPLATPVLKAKRSNKSLSPKKPPPSVFLSKYSNEPTAWDTKGRLDDMERNVEDHFGMLKEQIESATKERSNLQEHMDLYRTRSMPLEMTILPLLPSTPPRY